MVVVASNVRVIAKTSQTFDNGDTVYKAAVSNGEGGIANPTVSYDTWCGLVPFETIYDMEIEVVTSGYRSYLEIVGVHVS